MIWRGRKRIQTIEGVPPGQWFTAYGELFRRSRSRKSLSAYRDGVLLYLAWNTPVGIME